MFRNREMRRFAAVSTVITVTAAAVGFTIQPAAGILTLVSATALDAVFLVFTKARYKNIAKLSEQINLMFHNSNHLFTGETDEGEPSILQSKIIKMTLYIREQNDALKREKEHLVESMADIARWPRTPLISVNLILSLLESGPNEKERRTIIWETKGPSVQVGWLLASLLELSRPDVNVVAFQRKKIDVHDLMSSMLHSLLISMDLHNITLQTDMPKEILIQDGSNWPLETIQDILKNCLESTGDGGKIVITYGDSSLFTEITVRNNGVGFAKEDSPYPLNRFCCGKHAGIIGYGVGLAFCKAITTRQDGTVITRSHPQDGAVLSIRLLK